jgi:hypothetical protein
MFSPLGAPASRRLFFPVFLQLPDAPVRRNLGACCPNGTERGCPHPQQPGLPKERANSTGFGVVERAAAETAALRRLQNDLDNTPRGDGGSLLRETPAWREALYAAISNLRDPRRQTLNTVQRLFTPIPASA